MDRQAIGALLLEQVGARDSHSCCGSDLESFQTRLRGTLICFGPNGQSDHLCAVGSADLALVQGRVQRLVLHLSVQADEYLG